MSSTLALGTFVVAGGYAVGMTVWTTLVYLGPLAALAVVACSVLVGFAARLEDHDRPVAADRQNHNV